MTVWTIRVQYESGWTTIELMTPFWSRQSVIARAKLLHELPVEAWEWTLDPDAPKHERVYSSEEAGD